MLEYTVQQQGNTKHIQASSKTKNIQKNGIFLLPAPRQYSYTGQYTKETFMKSIQFGIFALVLAACSPAVTFYPYDGAKHITGEGGFYEGRLQADTLGHSLFEPAPEYKYMYIDIYASGLPRGGECTLLGHISSSDMSQILKTVFEMGGNVITGSDISMPVKFQNAGGVLDTSASAGKTSITTLAGFGASTTTIYRYNIFECQ